MTAKIQLEWLSAFLATVLLAGLVATLNLAAEIGQPFGGYKSAYAITANEWRIDSLTPPWWPAIVRDGLQPADVLESLEGRPYGVDAAAVYARASEAAPSAVSVSIRRAGRVFEVRQSVSDFTLIRFFDIKIPEAVTGLGFWLIAVAVYRARPALQLNRAFALACALIAGGQWLTVHNLFGDATTLSRGLTFIWAVMISWIGAAIVRFAALFPTPIAPRWWWAIRAMNLTSVMVAGAYAVALGRLWTAGWSPDVGRLGDVGWRGAHLLFLVGILFFVMRFGWLLIRRSTPPRAKRQLAVVVAGTVIAGPYILTTLFHGLTSLRHSHFWRALDVRYLLLAAPLAFAFVVLRYQTFRSRNPVLIGVALLAGAALAASLGAGAVYWLYPAAGGPPFLPVFITTLAASVFWAVQNTRRGLLNRLFHQQQISYGATQRFGQAVLYRSAYDVGALSQVLAATLVSELEIERSAVWLWQKDRGHFHLAGAAGALTLPPPQNMPAMPAEVPGGILRLRNLEGNLPAWIRPLLASDMEVACPLWAAGEVVGLLGLGKRWDDEIFDERDLEVVTLISQQSGLFLLTARQLEELARVPRQVAEAQERERGKIARELHDHTEQFLASLSLNLAISQKTAALAPERTAAQLQACLEDVAAAARALRRIRTNLAPRQLERGFAGPLDALVDRFRARCNASVNLELDPALNDVLTLDSRHGLYRVIQQALDNVAEHARAATVNVVITRMNGRIEFSIADDGLGFSEARRAQAQAEGCFGLYSMQDRVALLGGELVVQSSPGSGVVVSGWLPA